MSSARRVRFPSARSNSCERTNSAGRHARSSAKTSKAEARLASIDDNTERPALQGLSGFIEKLRGMASAFYCERITGIRVLAPRPGPFCGNKAPGTTPFGKCGASWNSAFSGRLRVALQPRRDRTVDDPRTETKLICVPCDRTVTDKQQRQEANYSCGP